jgi:hypothetical protein
LWTSSNVSVPSSSTIAVSFEPREGGERSHHPVRARGTRDARGDCHARGLRRLAHEGNRVEAPASRIAHFLSFDQRFQLFERTAQVAADLRRRHAVGDDPEQPARRLVAEPQ